MSKDLKFEDLKSEITGMLEDTLKKNLDGKNYDQNDAKSIIKQIVDEVISNLKTNHKEFKFVVNGTIFQKGDSSLHYSCACLWNPNTDGSTSAKYENDTCHAFVNVFGIVP